MRHLSGSSRTITWRSYGYCWTTKLHCLDRKRFWFDPYTLTCTHARMLRATIFVLSCGIMPHCMWVWLTIIANFILFLHCNTLHHTAFILIGRFTRSPIRYEMQSSITVGLVNLPGRSFVTIDSIFVSVTVYQHVGFVAPYWCRVTNLFWLLLPWVTQKLLRSCSKTTAICRKKIIMWCARDIAILCSFLAVLAAEVWAQCDQ